MSEENKNTPAKQEESHSSRFTTAIMTEFRSNAGDIELTKFQKKLIQNYFIKLDAVLKAAELKRPQSNALEFGWSNINMHKLATDVVASSSVGLDPCQPNHIHLIPYKNNKTMKYDINPMIGYRGLQLKSDKYGMNPPDSVVIELVYSEDDFKEIKKSVTNDVENYTLKIKDSFNRGDIVGGFYYHMYDDHPQRNKLKVFSLADIEKRKPKYASAEFWGGQKDEWKNGQKTGNKITLEGWHKEMCSKTLFRAAYNDITIDSEKIDEHLVKIMSFEESISIKQPEIEDIQHTVVEKTASEEKTFTESEEKKTEEESETEGDK